MDVVCGLLWRQGKVLIARRQSGKLAGFWEFPGGKVEPGESPPAALVREMQEEFRISVEVGEFFGAFPHTEPDLQLNLLAYHCYDRGEVLTPAVHDAFEFVELESLGLYQLAPADVAIVERLSRTGSPSER